MMDENPFSNPFDEDDRKKQARDDNAPVFIGSDTNLNPMEEGGESGQTLKWILAVAGIGICCSIFAIAAFILFQPDAQGLIGRYFPLAAPKPTRTLNYVATQRVLMITSTSKAAETLAAQAGNQWQIVFSDTFDGGSTDWRTGTDNDEYAEIVRTMEDGKYHWTATSKKGFVSRVSSNARAVGDFYLTAEVERLDDFDGSDYGLVFREDSRRNFYYFGIDRGSFFVALYFNGEWSDVITWTKSSAILPNGKNRLTVIGQGSHFTFLVNDRRLGDVSNDRVSSGKVGLAMQIHSGGRQAIIEFDNVVLRTPAPPATTTPTITLTPTLTPTPHVLITPPEGILVFHDNFDSNENGWEAYSSETTVEIKNGSLHVRSLGNEGIAYCQGCPVYNNAFYFQAEIVPGFQSDILHGLAFCGTEKSNQFYAFYIDSTSNRVFHLEKNTPEGLKTLVGGGFSRINNYPNSNTLAIFFDHGKIDMFINGTRVNSFEDQNPIECGKLGIYVKNGFAAVMADNIFAYGLDISPEATSTP